MNISRRNFLKSGFATSGVVALPHLYEGNDQARFISYGGVLDSQGDDFIPLSDALSDANMMIESAYWRTGGISGVRTGFIDLDNLLGGLHPSELVVLAGYASMGKSALAIDIALHIANTGVSTNNSHGNGKCATKNSVAVFSLKTSAYKLATEVLAKQTGISSEKIVRGQISRGQFQELEFSSRDLSGISLYIDDTPSLSLDELWTRAQSIARIRNPSLIIIDNANLINTNECDTCRIRHFNATNIAIRLKALAVDLSVPVMLLHQLPNPVDCHSVVIPNLTDLRKSILDDRYTDVIMFIFLEDFYLSQLEPHKEFRESVRQFQERYSRWETQLSVIEGCAKITIAKQRHGPPGTVWLWFDRSTS